MRIAPVLVPHLRAPEADLWIDAALCAAITHNDRASIAACVAFVGILWQLLGMYSVPPTEWWVSTYVAYAKPLEARRAIGRGAGCITDRMRGLFGGLSQSSCHWQSPRASLRWSPAKNGIQAPTCSKRYRPPCTSLMRHAGDPERAIIRAVNDTCDNDTIAALVGAAVGALHGEASLPARWRDNLLGRTAEADDGHVFELLDQAEALL